MVRAWEAMIALAYARGLTRLAWAMEHGVFDESDLIDRALVRLKLRTW
jgi:hypothetical protein